MSYSNGRLPSSALASIPGSGPYGGPHLRKDAARAYKALHRYSMKRWGISMALHEGNVGRAYRSYSRQVAAKRTYGSNAATPGTSNHGWGLAVDLMNRRQRWVIDQVGAYFGFSKKWSDASWEWWHVLYRPGRYSMVTKWSKKPFRVLRRGSTGKRVKWVQRRLRAKGIRKGVPKPSRPGYGYYGKGTKAAVKRFQASPKRKLKADGIVGRKTWRALAR